MLSHIKALIFSYDPGLSDCAPSKGITALQRNKDESINKKYRYDIETLGREVHLGNFSTVFIWDTGKSILLSVSEMTFCHFLCEKFNFSFI